MINDNSNGETVARVEVRGARLAVVERVVPDGKRLA